MTFKSMKMNDQIWKISALNTQYLYRTINLQLTVLIIFSKKKKCIENLIHVCYVQISAY